jgi:hypothetical protein
MTPLRLAHAGLAIITPIVAWSLLVALSPLIPPAMGFAGALFDVSALPLVLTGGFMFMRKALPHRPWLLGLVYFPIMAVVVLYLGVVVGFWMGQDAL